MLPLVWKAQQTKKNLLMWLGIFVFIFALYIFFDILANNSIAEMIAAIGLGMFVLHMGINLLLALLTSSMISLTQINLTMNKREPVGSNSIPLFSFLFGLLTFGCTPCVIAFLGAIGIAFTPLVLGPANIIWKIILLLLIVVAYMYILNRIHKTTCKPKSVVQTQS